MSKIITLSSTIIPKIAAGEVVQRPVSVVKELVENAIDSGASSIVVEVENAGLNKIKVIDNGEGMARADLAKCFLPHTTSKITTLEDLALIQTFGFRGEALNSICAVADVTIKSRLKGSAVGHEISVTNGNAFAGAVSSIEMGTVVEVANLFSNVPARKKFLKSALHENQYILNVLTAFALANTKVGFTFYRDGKLVFKVAEKDGLILRIEKLLGREFASKVLPVDFSDSYLNINGYIGKPQLGAPNRDTQFLFVNKRYVDDLPLAKVVKDAYTNLLDARSYPPFILNIELDWGLVDVNVHPQKEKVHFWNDSTIKKALNSAIKDTLAKYDLTYELDELSQDKKAIKHMYNSLKEVEPVWDVRQNNKDAYDQAFQVADTYIAYPQGYSLVLIDQHAAHESILYAQFSKSLSAVLKKNQRYFFDSPVTVEVPVRLKDVLVNNIARLKDIGIEVELFGDSLVKVIAITDIFKGHDIEDLLLGTLTDILEDKPNVISPDQKSLKTIAYLSCRSAIKAGDKLSPEEIKRLLIKLDECSDIYTCPHGRPVKVVVSNRELAKMFKRVK